MKKLYCHIYVYLLFPVVVLFVLYMVLITMCCSSANISSTSFLVNIILTFHIFYQVFPVFVPSGFRLRGKDVILFWIWLWIIFLSLDKCVTALVNVSLFLFVVQRSVSLIDMRDEEDELAYLRAHSQSRHEHLHNQYNKLKEEEDQWQDVSHIVQTHTQTHV